MRLVITFALVAGLAGCGGNKEATAGNGAKLEGDVEGAKRVFSERCVACHGTSGKGDGPAAAPLDPKPRSFGDPAWQKSVTDDHIEKVIREGGPAVGKSPLMPPNPDLADKPEVVKGLRSMVRSQGG